MALYCTFPILVNYMNRLTTVKEGLCPLPRISVVLIALRFPEWLDETQVMPHP
jgi:hypothetical protein